MRDFHPADVLGAGRKDRLDKLEAMSTKFDDSALKGLSGRQKAEKLLVV
jgi:hypothetical protein